MKFLTRLSIISLALVAASCASHSDDFLVKGTLRQRVPLSGAAEIVIQCYCPERHIVQQEKGDAVVLDVAGRYGSGGYHGTQDKPRRMPSQMLSFATKRDGNRAVLQSREFTFMHHALVLTRVTVLAPPGVEVRFEAIPREALYDRNVD